MIHKFWLMLFYGIAISQIRIQCFWADFLINYALLYVNISLKNVER